ncbi:MAG: hypothetical protein ACI8U1_003171 [Rheinheimera aquimaris]
MLQQFFTPRFSLRKKLALARYLLRRNWQCAPLSY